MIYGSAELCSIYADYNFGVTSIRTRCSYSKNSNRHLQSTVSQQTSTTMHKPEAKMFTYTGLQIKLDSTLVTQEAQLSPKNRAMRRVS